MEPQKPKAETLLGQKHTLFIKYEEVTDQILGETDFSAVEEYITKRDRLANEIDKVDAEITQTLAPWGEAARALLPGGIGDQTSLPADLQPLYPLCQDILAVIRRIRLKNTDILAEFQRSRDESLQKIKEGSALPKINRYLRGLAAEEERKVFRNV